MKPILPRPITEQEAAVIRQALLRTALAPIQAEVIRTINNLRVTGECECGCRSIEFEPPNAEEHQLSDGVGYLHSGERFDIIVWGRGAQVS